MTPLATLGTSTLAASLLAYIGPGPGLGMIGALIGLIVTVVTAIGAVLLWPLRTLWKKMKEDEEGDGEGDEQENATAEGAEGAEDEDESAAADEKAEAAASE